MVKPYSKHPDTLTVYNADRRKVLTLQLPYNWDEVLVDRPTINFAEAIVKEDCCAKKSKT